MKTRSRTCTSHDPYDDSCSIPGGGAESGNCNQRECPTSEDGMVGVLPMIFFEPGRHLNLDLDLDNLSLWV